MSAFRLRSPGQLDAIRERKRERAEAAGIPVRNDDDKRVAFPVRVEFDGVALADWQCTPRRGHLTKWRAVCKRTGRVVMCSTPRAIHLAAARLVPVVSAAID